MKIITTIAISLLTIRLLSAAETSATDQVNTAIAKLKEQPNYSWTTTLDMPGMPFTPEPVHGKVGEDGIAIVTQSFNGNDTQVIFKGGKIAILAEDQWEAVSTNQDAGGMGDFPAMIARMYASTGSAAQEATNLVANVKELKAGDDGLWTGDLNDKAVANLLVFGPRPGGDGPAVKNGKGTAKFWIKDGALMKFQSHATGTVPFGPDQEERDMDMTRTVEIQEVGKTKVEIPDAAKKKLEDK